MEDHINEKVINIFVKHTRKAQPSSEEEHVYTTSDGYKYVHIKYDESGNPFDEKKILDKFAKQWYIVKVLETHKGNSTIKNFKVSGERLVEFFESFINQKRSGIIIEIDRYFADELA